MTEFYLISTPLHLYVSCALALARKETNQAHLIFIDQYVNQEKFFLQVLDEWRDNPFKSIRVFGGREAKGINKFKGRKKIFQQLNSFIDSVPPETIFVGNDRRVEFQYMMHACRQKGLSTQGAYYDEGLFTYVGRIASDRWQERLVDSVIKKLFYGMWWDTPRTIGSSKWISKIYVSFPELVHKYLKNKKKEVIHGNFFQNSQLLDFSNLILHKKDISSSNIGKYKFVITLPEETDMRKIPLYRESMCNVVKLLCSTGTSIAIKYHPSARGRDVLELCNTFPVSIMADDIPFEAFLPLLSPQATVIGDMSSTLLTTKMLRPDIEVIGIETIKTEYYERFIAFFSAIGIEFITLCKLQKMVSQ